MLLATSSGTPFATAPGMSRSASPWMKAARSFLISFSFFFDMARRMRSACPSEKPASRRKISITCS